MVIDEGGKKQLRRVSDSFGVPRGQARDEESLGLEFLWWSEVP
jgi:hypothetical protein